MATKDRTKFKATMYVTAYQLAKDGLADKQIARAMGTTQPTLKRWCVQKPALADALARGREYRDPQNEKTFHEYVYDHLSPKLRKLWEEIQACEELENGVERLEALLGNHGIRTRQHLFLYALTQSMFNVSQSLRKLNIDRRTYDDWRKNDPDFAALMDEIHWHKQNFFESAFIGRVAAGDTTAIIHAVKTKCRDRGYNEKIEVEHTGQVNHAHAHVMIDITDLELPVAVRRQVLDALRAKQELEAKQ